MTVQAKLVDVAGSAISQTNPLPVQLQTGITLSGEVEVKNDAGSPIPVTVGNTVAVSGVQTNALTNAELRAVPVPVSGTMTANQGVAGAQAWPVSGPATNAELRANALPVSGPATNAELRASALPVAISGLGAAQASPLFVADQAGGLVINVTGALAAANTLTIPAVTGQFHYITAIEIYCYNGAARTGAAAPVTVTATNLNGLTELFPSAGVIGTGERVFIMPAKPLRSAAANTATTIVMPATTGILWHAKAIYFTAP